MTKEAFSRLYAIDVSGRIEKKNGLSYLSWAWAWQEVLKVDPGATWVVHQYGPPGNEQPCMWIGKTAMVHVSVTIGGVRRECMLPVMDHRNKAVPDPDARQVSDAIMRCMVKTVAMHGLGLFVYAGEDLPEAEDQPEPRRTTVIKATDGAGASLSADRKAEIEEIALHMIDCHTSGKDMDAIRIWYADGTFTDNDERVYCWSLMGAQSKLRATLKANKPEKLAA